MTTNPIKISILVLLIFLVSLPLKAASVSGLTPASWWANMPNNDLVILIKGKDLFGLSVTINYPGVTVTNVIPSAKPDYLILKIKIDENTTPGTVPVVLTDNRRYKQTVFLQLYERVPYEPVPLDITDAIYSIEIDRFANGNLNNDKPANYLETTDRTNPSGVHGGDLAGVMLHLDYIKNLGFTTIKLSPILENNQYSLSYRGATTTNFYQMDERVGTQSEYSILRSQLRQNDMKLIQSFVLHQAGSNNGLFRDMPMASWVVPDSRNYDINSLPTPSVDPHASLFDINTQLRQWESSSAPILNLKDENLRAYLLQSLIMWIERTEPDMIEIKSAWKNDPEFLNYLLTTLAKTHPSLKIILDAPYNRESHLEAWAKKFATYNNVVYNDYPISFTVADAFSNFTPSNDGCVNLYNILASDNLHARPNENIVFADGNNVNRAWNNADKNISTMKLMISYILTTRGIPMIHYGTETLLEGISTQNRHAFFKDFPGGWQNDPVDMFNQRNQNQSHIDLTQLITNILKWRAENKELMEEPLIHFVPRKGVYAYYRTKDEHTMMVIINNNKEPLRIDFKEYPESLGLYEKAKDIITGETFVYTGSILIQGKSSVALDMKPASQTTLSFP